MNHKYAACCLAIKDDFCLEESIAELFRQGVSRVLIVSPQMYWTDKAPQPPEDLEVLRGIAARTGAELESIDLKPESHPLYTEAAYRNYGLDLLARDEQLDCILTVDADEFWLPGTLEHIDSLAGPEIKVVLPGIPVMGVPGLPIEGAKDAIYVGGCRTLRFDWGRVVKLGTEKRGELPVIHFSATRRTLAEVADKMRKSAHYDDPVYDFEGWIVSKLPTVHVGMKDAHMYKSEENIWPRVRAWTEAELSALPPTLHPYLMRI